VLLDSSQTVVCQSQSDGTFHVYTDVMLTKSFPDEARLRTIIVASSGLAFACMFASLEAVRMKAGAGLELQWHWPILLFMAPAVLWNTRLWRAIWEVQDAPSAPAKRRLVRYLVGLVLIGIGSFLYPLLFVDEGYRHGVLKGVLTAAVFLTTLGWMFYRFAKAFEEPSEALIN
jgi:hypothetical protein